MGQERARPIMDKIKAQLNARVRSTPFNSWSAFLRMQAEQGSEIALAILRSRKAERAPETPHSLPLAPQKQPTPQTAYTSQDTTRLRK
jgi:hypothetical protein